MQKMNSTENDITRKELMIGSRFGHHFIELLELANRTGIDYSLLEQEAKKGTIDHVCFEKQYYVPFNNSDTQIFPLDYPYVDEYFYCDRTE
jgi:hypothetical protein